MEKKREMMGDKLRIARKLTLGVTQENISEITHARQANLSALELGKVGMMKISYLMWLAENGVNLNGIFDNRITPDEYAMMCENMSPASGNSYKLDAGELKNLKAELEVKNQTICDLREMVSFLKKLLPPGN
jgi:transcriptional regulator with XRE-family HTH domain